MKSCRLARSHVRYLADQQPGENESGHATSQTLLLGSNPLEPSEDEACSSTVMHIFELQAFPAARSNKPRVSLPPARQLAYEAANSHLARRFVGKDHPLRRHKGLSIGRSH